MSALTFKVSGDSSGLMRSLDGAKGALSGLAKVGKGLKIGGALASAASAVASLGLASRGLKAAIDMEQLEVAFEVLTGNAKDGRKAIASLMEFSDRTPLAPEEVVAAGRSLIAFGTNANDVVGVLERIGNVASGIGAPLGDIAEIYGKAQVQGRLFGEDMNQLAGRGIPIFESIADVMGVAKGEVKGLVEEGRVGFPELEKAFAKMSGDGGRFAGMLEKQSNTLGGLLSTLSGKFTGVLRDSAKEFGDTLKPVISGAISFLDEMKPKVVEFARTMANGVSMIIEAFKAGKLGAILKESMLIASKALENYLWSAFRGLGAVLAETMKMAGEGLAAGWRVLTEPTFWGSLESSFQGIATLFARQILDLLPRAMGGNNAEQSEQMKLQSEAEFLSARVNRDFALNKAGPADFGDVTARMRDAYMEAFISSGNVVSDSANREKLAEILEGLAKTLIDAKAAREEESEKKEKPVVPEIEAGGALGRVMAPVISSLGRVGGAGSGSLIPQSLDIKRNEYLRDIARNTGEMRSGSVAVYG